VDLVQVDPVRVQPLERALDLADDPAARVPELVRIVAHRPVHLGGQDHVLAPAAGQRLAHYLLRLAPRVHVGGVDEVDPRVERAVDDPDALVVVGVAPRAEHHRAQAERTDLDSGTSQRSVVHAGDRTATGCLLRRRRFSPKLLM
jgi:hypothetical protein